MVRTHPRVRKTKGPLSAAISSIGFRRRSVRQAAHEGVNLLQSIVLITGPEPVIIAIELNQSRPRYGAGQMTTSLDTHRPVAAAV